MSGFRQPERSREQMVLWAQRLDDAIPADQPVRHFDLLLRSSAFAETFTDWESDYVLVEGKPPYHPCDLAGLYLYGMMNRVRSSRQLEASTYNRLDVKWLLQGQHPDHSTIADFVKRHGKRLRKQSQDRKKWGTVKRRHYGCCAACASCEHASICCREPQKGRSVTRDQDESQREQMRSRMSTEAGRSR